MTPSRPDADPSAAPTVVPEHHVCHECGVDYPSVTIPGAVDTIRTVPDQARQRVLTIPPDLQRRRPDLRTWSIVEYVCHLRDVYATYTIRLHRARVEEVPRVDPMLNDLRALRFRYNERDPAAVLDELAANVTGFLEEVAATAAEDLARAIERLPGETRTARWLVRQAMHEGVHHLGDITRVGRELLGESTA